MSNVLVRWSGTEQAATPKKKFSERERWKINEIFRWDGKCLWHSTSYYARAATQQQQQQHMTVLWELKA